jgi:hypothetical protein
MTAERRERGYLCRTEVTAAPALSLNLFWNLPAHWLIGVTRPYNRKENARVKITVCWRSIGFAETLRVTVGVEGRKSVRPLGTVRTRVARQTLGTIRLSTLCTFS